MLFVEGAIAQPPARLGRVRDGAALLALRTDAPIVPVAICGAETLYRGRRIRVRFGAPTTVAALLAADGGATERPEPGSRDELRAARRVTRAICGPIEAAVIADHPTTIDPPAMPRRWTWLTRLMR